MEQRYDDKNQNSNFSENKFENGLLIFYWAYKGLQAAYRYGHDNTRTEGEWMRSEYLWGKYGDCSGGLMGRVDSEIGENLEGGHTYPHRIAACDLPPTGGEGRGNRSPLLFCINVVNMPVAVRVG